ncbi:hypothetical protein RUM44_009631 [Polyplax serrata]|uniref:Uncharacterized protein n=1 Tax=Polyplax serrata TaxID=468196 RepID=A0ABR1AT90_POLSC
MVGKENTNTCKAEGKKLPRKSENLRECGSRVQLKKRKIFAKLHGRLRNLTCRRVIASEHKKQDKCPEHGSSKKSSDSPKGKCFPNFFAVDPTLPFHYRVSTSSFTLIKWEKKHFRAS